MTPKSHHTLTTHTMINRLFPLLLLCITSQLALANQGEIQLQFVAFPKLLNHDPVELLIGDGETIMVELPTNSASPVYTVSGISECRLGVSSKGEKDEFLFKTYGASGLLNSPKQLILILRKGDKNSDGLELIPVASHDEGFGGGDYLFMNMSMVDIAVEIGDKVAALKPRKHRILSPGPSKIDGERKYLYVYIHFRRGEEAVPFYSSTWKISERRRSMVFFYHDPHTQQLRSHTVRSYL